MAPLEGALEDPMEIRNNAFDPARRPYPQADITRPNRETIDRSTPPPADASEVRERLAQRRADAAEAAQKAKEAQDVDISKRAHLARSRHTKRAHNARLRVTEATANRIQLARERARAAEGSESPATSQADSVEIAGKPAEFGARIETARDKLSLSDTTLRLQADVAPTAERSDARIAELRALREAGTLNTDDLIARAAFKLLSGE